MLAIGPNTANVGPHILEQHAASISGGRSTIDANRRFSNSPRTTPKSVTELPRTMIWNGGVVQVEYLSKRSSLKTLEAMADRRSASICDTGRISIVVRTSWTPCTLGHTLEEPGGLVEIGRPWVSSLGADAGNGI